MLCYPWRNEDTLLDSEQTYTSKFYESEVHTTVEQNRTRFEPDAESGVPNDTKTGNLTYDSTSTANVFPHQLQLIINFPGKKISALHC